MEIQTLLDLPRLEAIQQYVRITNNLGGCIAEVGVYKGGSSVIIANAKRQDKKLYLFDTFEGMPETSDKDNHHKKGDFNDVSYDEVAERLANYPNVFIHKGFFPQETGRHVDEERFSFVHLDVDIYQSFQDCLKFFYPRMLRQSIMTFDDYSGSTCLGVKYAVDEFFADKPEALIWPVGCQISVVKS